MSSGCLDPVVVSSLGKLQGLARIQVSYRPLHCRWVDGDYGYPHIFHWAIGRCRDLHFINLKFLFSREGAHVNGVQGCKHDQVGDEITGKGSRDFGRTCDILTPMLIELGRGLR